MKIKINWGVEFNTNNYERTIDLDVVVEMWQEQVEWSSQPKVQMRNIEIPELVDFIDDWFYDNISELTSCDDEFIKDNNNKYFTDYVRYELVD